MGAASGVGEFETGSSDCPSLPQPGTVEGKVLSRGQEGCLHRRHQPGRAGTSSPCLSALTGFWLVVCWLAFLVSGFYFFCIAFFKKKNFYHNEKCWGQKEKSSLDSAHIVWTTLETRVRITLASLGEFSSRPTWRSSPVPALLRQRALLHQQPDF